MKVTILNTSIITSHGSFLYKPCSLELAKQLVEPGFQSAIGHDSTAAVISTLLSIDCKTNRIQYKQQPGATALVFKLKGRAPEGSTLTAKEIETIGYEWGILKRLQDEPAVKNVDQGTGTCELCELVTGLDDDGLYP